MDSITTIACSCGGARCGTEPFPCYNKFMITPVRGRISAPGWTWGLLFLVVLTGLALAVPHRVWTFLMLTLGGGWGFCFFWMRQLARGLVFRRELRYGWAQVGDRLEERITLENHSWLPAIWVEIEDAGNAQQTLPSHIGGCQVSWVDGNASQVIETEGVCTRRGLYTLGPTTLRAADPFGWFFVEWVYPQQMQLLVMPPTLPLPEIQIASGAHAGEGRRLRKDPFEMTVNAAGVRAYLPGDPLRMIHWPTSARQAGRQGAGESGLYVRQEESTPAGNWWICLDLAAPAQVGDGAESTVEHGIILAASLVEKGLRERHAVGVAINGSAAAWLPPGAVGAMQQVRALHLLAQAATGEHSLEAFLEAARGGFPVGGCLVLITPDLEGSWLKSLLPLREAGMTPTVLLLDRRTFGAGGLDTPLPIQGWLRSLGIAHYLLAKDLLDRPEAQPGRQGQWDWLPASTGATRPLRRPANLEWRRVV